MRSSLWETSLTPASTLVISNTLIADNGRALASWVKRLVVEWRVEVNLVRGHEDLGSSDVMMDIFYVQKQENVIPVHPRHYQSEAVDDKSWNGGSAGTMLLRRESAAKKFYFRGLRPTHGQLPNTIELTRNYVCVYAQSKRICRSRYIKSRCGNV